jgi:hypothetical protein
MLQAILVSIVGIGIVFAVLDYRKAKRQIKEAKKMPPVHDLDVSESFYLTPVNYNRLRLGEYSNN